MTTRQAAIVAAKIAGYHNDTKTFTRLRIEVRVNNHILTEAWWAGQAAKERGVPCSCLDCRKEIQP